MTYTQKPTIQKPTIQKPTTQKPNIQKPTTQKSNIQKPNIQKAIEGCILGTAIGDSVGLPCENLNKSRQLKLFPDLQKQNLFFGKGMISDDTEHTYLVAKSLIYSAGEIEKFQNYFSRQLKLWLLGLPAGIGSATLRAILKLCLGFSADNSGVFSAGNGPSMRSAIIGVCYGDQPDKLAELIRCSTKITHTDPKAEIGAYAVSLAAYHCSVSSHSIKPTDYVNTLMAQLTNNAEKDQQFSL